MVLESSVDYESYRTAYGKQLLQQQPEFECVEDAEEELRTRISCASAACSLPRRYIENNARLVQRHLVKRTYAELSVEATDYEPTLWLLLAFLHLITEFQTDTYGLCRDTGTKLLLALNEQFLKHDGYQSIPQSPLVFNNAGKAQRGLSGARPDSLISTYSLPPPESSPAARWTCVHSSRTEDGSLIRSASETRDQTVQRIGSRTARTSIASSTTLCRRSSSGHSTPVVELLAQRIDCCKTFTENLVFLLNRETEPSTQVLILHMLYCILTDPSTSCILYTNDMFVLIDIVIRDLANLSDGLPKQRQAYLLVTSAILRNSVYLTTRHRLSDIELCLVNLLRHSLVSSHASASEKHESHAEPPLPPPSMRHFSTPRLSTASDLSISVPEPFRDLAKGIAQSPTTATTAISHGGTSPPTSHAFSTVTLTGPTNTTGQAASSTSASTTSLIRTPAKSETNGGHRQHRRRAPPPPPPTPMSAMHTPLSASKSSSCAMPSLVPPPQPPMQRSTHRRAGSRAAPPPLPVRAVDKPSDASSGKQTPPPPLPRRARAMSTGIRRQLSVKNSVSKYKRSHRAQPPPVPTSTPAGAPARMGPRRDS
ncbi:hypothetical protein DL89DRAFT_302549 [Linderina pennispora]|uniref:SPIN90/Ldb17 leucine-rich domain-containing protein n=1 Tax=Linderina pennispora TaxID=61395 RepID=A0A1Y1W2R0_9FUNG|nr:uncharacterized protein DL89DRAFT_302549 [Linderina pennispora]ORX67737.1 hypothetical protein DL89DRAFT_302549 [Linderina pennispora]